MHRIRLATGGDDAAHRELLGERLPGSDLDARLDWIYRGNPHGPGRTWIAFVGDEPAGMTTFFGRKLWVEGRVVDGALGGDMYVRPRFRRRGIGTDLFIAARADMERLGVRVMFGTPMQPNVSSLVTSGSTVPLDSVVRYARLLGGSARRLSSLPGPVRRLLDPLLKARAPRGVRLVPITGLDARVDRVWEETRHELAIATVRDAEFYRWRFVEAPSKTQRPFLVLDGERPIAACALETVKDKLRVVDLLAPIDRWRTAVNAIAAAAANETGLEIRLAAADAARRRLWTLGLFARDRMPMSMLTPEGSPEMHLHDPDRWFLTWADTDIDHW